MKCTDAGQLLSAYYDGEMSVEARDAVRTHLADCSDCAAELADFQRLTSALAELPKAAVPVGVWEQISAQLDAETPGQPAAAPATLQPVAERTPRRSTYPSWAIAASILLCVGLGFWVAHQASDRTPHHDAGQHGAAHHGATHHGAEFALTMDHYLETLSDDPDQAERFLLNKYNGQTVAPEAAVEFVGYRPAIAEGLPEGYSLTSTSVLRMPCCTCVKAVCKRGDGSTLVLFEHDDDPAAWFGQRHTDLAVCGDQQCCLVDLDSSIAATWKRGSRSVTAVGIRDVGEVDTLVRWLDRNAAGMY